METKKISELFYNSIAMMIDDEVDVLASQANTLKKDFETRGVKFITFKDIPGKEFLASFDAISFIIIDWKLHSDYSIDKGNLIWGSELIREEEERVLDLLGVLLDLYFVPIFIFTKEDTNYIVNQIEERENLKKCLESNQLIVEDKSSLDISKIEELFKAWCSNNPAAYALKQLDKSLLKAKSKLLNALSTYDNQWPLIVYNTLKEDAAVDADREFNDFLSDLLMGYLEPITLDDEIMSKEISCLDRDNLISLYDKAKFIPYTDKVISTSSYTGDVYVLDDNDNRSGDVFLINITATCDLRKHKMIFLVGKPIKIEGNLYSKKTGVIEKKTHALISAFCNYECVEFKFDSFFVMSIDDSGDFIEYEGERYKRIGRLLYPYVSNIQERFSHYICRKGTIRHPNSLYLVSYK